MVLIIDDDPEMLEIMGLLMEKMGQRSWCTSVDALAAMAVIEDEEPDLIFLDVMLNGPDGFTFLNELQSDHELSKIPIVLMTSLDIFGKDLSSYGVVGILDKSTMMPKDIEYYVFRYQGRAEKKNGGK